MKCCNFRYGNITEIIKIPDEEIIFITIITDTNDFYSSTVLVTNPSTLIVDENLKEAKIIDLRVGDFVVAYHSPIMTKSIPPQTQTFIIERR